MNGLPGGGQGGDAIGGEEMSGICHAMHGTAEARRQSKIDAAVRERLAVVEEDIRREVTAKVDAEGAQA